jgi:hypothetical protein
MAGSCQSVSHFEQAAVGAGIFAVLLKGGPQRSQGELMVRRFIYGGGLSADVRLIHGLQLTTSFLLMKLPESVYVFFS